MARTTGAHRRLTTRAAVVALSAALTAVSLVGCSNPGDAPGSGGAAAAGKGLVVGITSDPDTLFPWKATQFQAVGVLGLLYGTLTELDGTLEVKPGLAEKWAWSADQRTLTLTLRDGVKFSDGTPLTSEDVKYSLEAIKDEKTAAVARSTLASVDTVTATDPRTVTLALSAPDAALLAGLSTTNLSILKKGTTESQVASASNGTGPFTISSRTPGRSLKLAPNAGYWGGAPKLPSLEFRTIPDATSVVSAMQSGAVQFANLDDPLVAKSAEGSGIKVDKVPQLSYHVLQLKASAAPLDDVNLRLAIACAVDRKQVLDTAAGGEGEVTGPITSPAYKSDPGARPCPTRDLDKAKAYLAKSKSPKGATLKTIVSQGEYATSVNEAQSLKAQLAEAGITLDLEVLESGAYVKRWVAGDFQAAIALNGGRPDPDAMYGRYFTSKGNLNTVAGYSSPQLDALFAKGKATVDPAARKAVYEQIGTTLENEAPWVWLFTGYTYTATKGVNGFTPMPTGSLLGLRSATLS